MNPMQQGSCSMAELVKGYGIGDGDEIIDVNFKQGVHCPTLLCEQCAEFPMMEYEVMVAPRVQVCCQYCPVFYVVPLEHEVFQCVWVKGAYGLL